MNRAQRIRAWLAEQDGPRTGAQIAAGIGMADDNLRVHWAIAVMYRDGVLERVGEARGYRYSLGREVKSPLSPEEAQRRKNERQRLRSHMRKKGVRPLAEWREIRQQRKAERLARKTAEREERFARTQERRRLARERAEMDKQARKQRPKPRPRPALKLAPDVPKPAPVALQRLETVDEYLARGGRIERLPVAWDLAA